MQGAGRGISSSCTGGGNDSLNTLVSHKTRPTTAGVPIAVPAGQVPQVHRRRGARTWTAPAVGGLLNVFNQGRLALVQRAGYENCRSHFEAGDIWGTANPQSFSGSGWLGRYLDTLPRPLDALAAWHTTAETPHALLSALSGVPAIANAGSYTYASPNRGSAALQERAAAQAMATNPASGRPHLAYVNSTSLGAIQTLDRVALVTSYTPSVVYPNEGFAQSLRTVAGAIVKGVGSRVFWVTTGGYDTHSGQGGGAAAPTPISWAPSATAWGRFTTTSATRVSPATRPSLFIPSSAGASRRTEVRAPITAPRV